MKRFLTVICYMLLVILITAGCRKSTYEISIKTDPDSYTLLSSAVQGIKMSPELLTNDENAVIEYSWTTTEGSFIGTKDKESVIGDSVIWSPIADKSSSAPTTVTITLEAKEKKTGKVLVKTNLTVDENNATYTVKK